MAHFSILGMFGNILTLIVTIDGHYGKSAHGLYITAMAVADIVFLTTQPFNRSFAYYLFGRDIRATSIALCKVYYFFLRWTRPMSSLVIVLICVERFVAIWFPLKSRIFFQQKRCLDAGYRRFRHGYVCQWVSKPLRWD